MEWPLTESSEGWRLRAITSANGSLICWPTDQHLRDALKAFGQLTPKGVLRWRKTTTGSLDADLISVLESQLSDSFPYVKFRSTFMFIGEPTPYQKATAALTDGTGDVVAYVKMALTAEAQERIEKELDAASFVNSRGPTEMAPRVLAVFHAPRGRSPVFEPLAGRIGPRTLGLAHAQWVETQQGALAARGSQIEDAFRVTESSVPLVLESLEVPARTYEDTLDEVLNGLSRSAVTLAMAHGDFTPWNIRVDGPTLRALDWEGAITAAPPLYDLFYHAMVTSRSRFRMAGPWDERVRAICSTRWPELQSQYRLLRSAFLVFALRELAEVSRLDAQPGPTWRWLSQRLVDQSVD